MDPRNRRTSRQSKYQTRPMACRDLLLVGMATSTNFNEASVSHKAITLGFGCQAQAGGIILSSYSRNVDVGSLSDGLVVDSGVGDDDDSGLLERSGDVVGEVTGGAVE